MATPEGRVKAKVNRLLDKYKGHYRFMPVPYGYGASSLDYLICYRGRFIAVETKAPGGKPTDRQKMIIQQIHAAGGIALVVDGDAALEQLRDILESLSYEPHTRISKT